MSHVAFFKGGLGAAARHVLPFSSVQRAKPRRWARSVWASTTASAARMTSRICMHLSHAGYIYTRTETYHIDPVDDHFGDAALDFDHVIYRLSDMNVDLCDVLPSAALALPTTQHHHCRQRHAAGAACQPHAVAPARAPRHRVHGRQGLLSGGLC